MTTHVLPDGHSTLIVLNSGAIKFKVKSVTPFGFSGGGKNEQTTMENVAVRTALPKILTDVTDCTAKVAYDSEVLDDIISVRQVNQEIHVEHGDGEIWAFFGWLEEFQPGESKEGEQPEATVKFMASNIDPTDGSETVPWMIAAATTTTTA